MSLFKKSVGFLMALAMVPMANAATARPSIVTQMVSSSRLPSLVGLVPGTSGGSSTVTTTTQEYIDNYVACLHGADVCGASFEECTNKTLFFSQKAACASTLLTMPAAALTSLYGNATTTAYANKNTDGTYVYPTDGSVLGQMIAAGYIANRYDTQTCVRRYTSCLRRDDTCGADFELCTTPTAFKKQKLFCESTIARCETSGIEELFGNNKKPSDDPTSQSRIGIMISEGAALAAVNAVATCYKVVDTCILNTCASNPYKCKEGSDSTKVCAAADIVTPEEGDPYCADKDVVVQAVNRNDVSGFIKNSCIDTIGANQFCYATYLGDGKLPTNAQLRDEDNKADIYAEAYADRMNPGMQSKIDELITSFDKRMKQHCQDTIVQCAMKSCGGGSGPACYASAFKWAREQSVNNPYARPDIKKGCEHIVNNDNYCKYAAATFDAKLGIFDFEDKSIFDVLFPIYSTSNTNPDPVSAVAALNSKLSLAYSQTALDNMKKSCISVADNCIRTSCGSDFTNCYRNRIDVFSSLTDSGNSAFDRSMNKVGGVLDRTIVLGLCVNTVRNASICQEHLEVEAARFQTTLRPGSEWGVGGIGGTWLDAGSAMSVTAQTAPEEEWYQAEDFNGNLLCTTANRGCPGEQGPCNTTVNNCTFTEPVMIKPIDYYMERATEDIFATLVNDIDAEVQGIYNAKLTHQQNMCMEGAANGIMGNRESGGTFMWVKLRGNRVPNDYLINGLKTSNFTASNDIYNSFCRIRVTLQSDDKNIQAKIADGSNWSTAYFAAGDAFTCGSWIPQSDLDDISAIIAGEQTGTNASGRLHNGQGWAVAGASLVGILGGAVGGQALVNNLQKNGGIGGIGNHNRVDRQNNNRKAAANSCVTFVDNYKATGNRQNNELVQHKLSQAGSAINQAQKIDRNASAVDIANKQYNTTNSTCSYSKSGAGTESPTDDCEAEIAKLDTAIFSLGTYCQGQGGLSADAKGSDDKMNAGDWVGLTLGAGIGGTLTGVITGQALKASNRAEFDAVQQEWLNNVGKHIRCYIGGDEVGTYGDMISTSME